LKLIKIILKIVAIFILSIAIYLSFIFLKPMFFSSNELEKLSYENVFSQTNSIQFKEDEIYFFLFDPECESCVKIKEKVKLLEKNNVKNIYFITENQNKKDILNFIKNNNLQKHSNNFLIDYRLETKNNFNLSPVLELPTMIKIKKHQKIITKL
jgi:hypothetical protein